MKERNCTLSEWWYVQNTVRSFSFWSLFKNSKKLLSELADVDAYIVSRDQYGNIQKYTTKGFQDLIIQ